MNNKPLCINCPAVRRDKAMLYCSLDKNLKAAALDQYALKRMNDECPIDWEPEGANQ